MIEKTIYYHDTDAGGVVYYANYLKFMEEARTEFLRVRGIRTHSDFLYAVRSCAIEYRAPARYGDVVRCSAEIKKIGGARIIFTQVVTMADSGVLLASAEITLACLTKDFQPSPIPKDVRARLRNPSGQ